MSIIFFFDPIVQNKSRWHSVVEWSFSAFPKISSGGPNWAWIMPRNITFFSIPFFPSTSDLSDAIPDLVILGDFVGEYFARTTAV